MYKHIFFTSAFSSIQFNISQDVIKVGAFSLQNLHVACYCIIEHIGDFVYCQGIIKTVYIHKMNKVP